MNSFNEANPVAMPSKDEGYPSTFSGGNVEHVYWPDDWDTELKITHYHIPTDTWHGFEIGWGIFRLYRGKDSLKVYWRVRRQIRILRIIKKPELKKREITFFGRRYTFNLKD